MWLREVFVQHVDESLDVALGAGEREAISLALELHADVLLIENSLVGSRLKRVPSTLPAP